MIFEKLQEMIAEQLGKESEDIQMETNFRTDLNADSLDLFQIINDIEDEFDVKIDAVDGLDTVGDVVKVIEEQLK